MRTYFSKRFAVMIPAALLTVIGGSLAACSDFLKVENPGAVEEANVNNPAYMGLLVNGVIGEFQPAFSGTALYSAVLTDDATTCRCPPISAVIDSALVLNTAALTFLASTPAVRSAMENVR